MSRDETGGGARGCAYGLLVMMIMFMWIGAFWVVFRLVEVIR